MLLLCLCFQTVLASRSNPSTTAPLVFTGIVITAGEGNSATDMIELQTRTPPAAITSDKTGVSSRHGLNRLRIVYLTSQSTNRRAVCTENCDSLNGLVHHIFHGPQSIVTILNDPSEAQLLTLIQGSGMVLFVLDCCVQRCKGWGAGKQCDVSSVVVVMSDIRPECVLHVMQPRHLAGVVVQGTH